MKRKRQWVKQAAIGFGVTIAALATFGAIWEAVASAAGRRNLAPSGKMVDVGGHRLHIYCVGEGHPTLVLESGAASMSALWGHVQPLAARHTRVCSYDRAGLGWSEPGPGPRDAVSIARELHALLKNAGEAPPYILVGYSYGGMLIRVYADQYPEQVVGLVLLDASYPGYGKHSAGARYFVCCVPLLARIGVTRFILRSTGLLRVFDDLPPEPRGQAKAFYSDASHISAATAEFRVLDESMRQIEATRHLGDLPLIVITIGRNVDGSRRRESWHEVQRGLAGLSNNSSYRILEQANHASMLTRQEHAVEVDRNIREVVEGVRADHGARMHSRIQDY